MTLNSYLQQYTCEKFKRNCNIKPNIYCSSEADCKTIHSDNTISLF